MNDEDRYRVVTAERHGQFVFSLLDTVSGDVLFDEGKPLDYYFAAAAMLKGGTSLEETRRLLAVRPIPKKCCG